MRIDTHIYIGWILALILFGAVFGVSLVAKEVQESKPDGDVSPSPIEQLEQFLEENDPPSPLVDGDDEPVACTVEAKLCPDGSAVGRTGPNCEFSPCPGGGGGGILPYNSGVQGEVLLGPQCPVMRDPPDPECADKKYETRLVLTTPDGVRVISEFSSDAEGRFRVSAAPGEYAIRSAVAANVWPYCSTNETVQVGPDAYTETTVYCDTGIR